MNKNTVLFEIGIEELPARFIDRAEEDLLHKTTTWLQDERIAFLEANTFSTPRRLAIIIKGIEDKQETIVEKVRGPKIDIAKDNTGNWTKAAIGFSKSQGKSVDDLFIEDVKGVSYTFVEKRIEGKNTIDVLSNFTDIIKSISFQQTMRWGDNSFRFARPIRWLVALMNEKIIPMEIAGVEASNVSFGHRFLGSKITLNNPDEYEKKLSDHFVIVNPDLREEMIKKQIKQLENEQHFYIDMKQSLLNEVRNLVEYPTVFYGRYDESFLSLPEEVLITSMREHQRYFPVFTNEHKEKLLPYFVSVRNGDNEKIENVIQGNEKVLRARLADARFFYDEDRNESIENYIEKLKSVIFQEELGTVYDKTVRVKQLANEISKLVQLSFDETTLLTRAAAISKFDLVTYMVNEFPELQGIMGEKYALHFNENEAVAATIKEHYKPLHATDSLPSSKMASILSVADKLDTIIGTISIGLIPSGSQDPYGLRRQAIAILRILLEQRWNVSFELLLSMVQKQFSIDNHKETLMKFFKDRAIYILNANGIERDVIEAVIYKEIGILPYTFAKAKLLSDKRNDPSFKLPQESFIRVLNMTKEINHKEINEQLFQTESEQQLYSEYLRVKDEFKQHETNLNAEKALENLEKLAEPIYEFFEHNMVMDPNDAIKHNRLSLLYVIAELIKQFANFNLIEWKQHI